MLTWFLPQIPEPRPMFPRALASRAWGRWRGLQVDPAPREALLGRLSPDVRARAVLGGARWPRWALRAVCGVRRPRNARERAAVAQAERAAEEAQAERWRQQRDAEELREIAEELRAEAAAAERAIEEALP